MAIQIRSTNTRSMKRRTGYTLVEILATLGVLMVLGMAAAKLLASVTDIGIQTTKNKQARAMTERLAQQLRNDIASAEQVSISADGTTIDLQNDLQQVQYVVDVPSHSVRRITTEDSQQTSQEQYRLVDRCSPVFSRQNEIVRLQLMPESQTTLWTIEAVKR